MQLQSHLLQSLHRDMEFVILSCCTCLTLTLSGCLPLILCITILLGLVKRETELNLQMLTCSKWQELIGRVKSVRMPYDIGRLPTNIFDTGEGLGSITADRWKIYITCYAQPCMYKLLPGGPYKCLVMLAEIVKLLVSPVFTDKNISTMYRSECTHHFFVISYVNFFPVGCYMITINSSTVCTESGQ